LTVSQVIPKAMLCLGRRASHRTGMVEHTCGRRG
jgi:hypothetical protein